VANIGNPIRKIIVEPEKVPIKAPVKKAPKKEPVPV